MGAGLNSATNPRAIHTNPTSCENQAMALLLMALGLDFRMVPSFAIRDPATWTLESIRCQMPLVLAPFRSGLAYRC
jgi:hypothetical protein